MSDSGKAAEVKEIAAIFHDADALENAVEDLESHGFDRAEISLLADENTIRERLGHIYSSAEKAMDDPDAPRTAFVSSQSRGEAEGALVGGLLYVGAMAGIGAVVASGGPVTAAISTAVLAGGGGAALGTLLAGLVEGSHLHHIEEQIKKGGLLLWVHTRDADHVARATQILHRHVPKERHIHFHKRLAGA